MSELAQTTFFVWDIDPQVFSTMPLPRWYSLLFAIGILGGFAILKAMLSYEKKPHSILDGVMTYGMIGMVVGMRLGHVLFYQPDYYINHLHEIPMIWLGGYASHGGFLGLAIAMYLYVKRNPPMTFTWLVDRVSIASLFAAGFIRIGNFFNSEILGNATTAPWAVIFAKVDQTPRHPAQLYEAAGYLALALLFGILYRFTAMKEKGGMLFGGVIASGFLVRFICEFFKEDQSAFEAGMLINMGQILSIPFILGGIAFIAWANKAKSN